MTLGEKIVYFRKAQKLTQKELADLAGISRITIGFYERDQNQPPFDVVESLAEALNIPIERFSSKRVVDTPIERPFKDDYYLDVARVIATRSTCLHHKYGAVIVNDDIIVATGYNGAPRGEVNCCDAGRCYRDTHSKPLDATAAEHGDQYGTCVAVHAESNALIAASRKELIGATLYLACLTPGKLVSPCNYCDRMIKNAGISKVVTQEGVIWQQPPRS